MVAQLGAQDGKQLLVVDRVHVVADHAVHIAGRDAGVGAMLAHIASRTSPTVEEIARIETSVIAAAAIFVLAAIVNVLLADLLMRQIETNEYLGGTLFDRVAFFALPALSVLLWLALERRLTRLRRERRDAAARRNAGR